MIIRKSIWLMLWLFVAGALCSIAGTGETLREIDEVEHQQELSVAQERMFWVRMLHKIAYPVIHNLAEGTLHENMPLEEGPGYGGKSSDVSYLEAVGRALNGVAPWLALPDSDSEEGAMRKRTRDKVLIGLKNAVDPGNPDYLNFRKHRQPIVDAAFLAQAFLRAPDALWEPLDSITKSRFVAEYKTLRDRSVPYNNWLLFSGINETFLMKIGEDYDPFRIDMARNKIKEWYVGDGWYSDGELFSMDYYNDFVIQPMLIDMLRTLLEEGKIPEEEYDLALRRMVRHAEFIERFISPEGTFPVFGRSITYRSAVFQSLAQVALMEILPEHIQPGQVRSALTLVHKKLYEGDQNFDENGWLILGLNGHQPEMADTYTSTGSLYMATFSFLPLGLPANSKFWTDAPAAWTSKKAWSGKKVKKDYKVSY